LSEAPPHEEPAGCANSTDHLNDLTVTLSTSKGEELSLRTAQ
jgi:hypothetical protein